MKKKRLFDDNDSDEGWVLTSLPTFIIILQYNLELYLGKHFKEK